MIGNTPESIFDRHATLNGSITHLLRGDYNNNGQVEQGDLDLVLLNWGRDASTPPAGWTSDLPSGLIDQDELDRLLLHWGDDMSMFAGLPAEQGRVGQAGAVPEPGTSALVAIVMIMMAGRPTAKPQIRESRKRRQVIAW